jgi:GH15 family glucan-1,4-alpha-glucosidase
VRSELAHGAYVYRYSGMEQSEGAFVACSFWLAEALAREGTLDDAEKAMDAAIGLGNELGLFSEEAEPATGELLGNFPQALSHLALINAAAIIKDASEEKPTDN